VNNKPFGKLNVGQDETLPMKRTKLFSKASKNKVRLGLPSAKTRLSKSMAGPLQIYVIA
jgi:hypothetical protein